MERKVSIVVLTGAGVSAESGLKTFRDNNGLWEDHRVEDVATYAAFARNPELVHRFYNARREQLLSSGVFPNVAHEALAEFESIFPGEFLIVTQNVDNLHERAGSRNVIHMHGELLKMRCKKTNRIFLIEEDINSEMICSCCDEPGNLRPHIVWFGETPIFMKEIYDRLETCDYFISIGTSGQVYPAAAFADQANFNAKKIEVNVEKTQVSWSFDECINEVATIGVVELVERLKSELLEEVDDEV